VRGEEECMSGWKTRTPGGLRPPKKPLSYLQGGATFIIDGDTVSGQEFVKVYECVLRGDTPPNTQVARHALLWLQSNGHIERKGGSYHVA
jgi:hypothetical protein